MQIRNWSRRSLMATTAILFSGALASGPTHADTAREKLLWRTSYAKAVQESKKTGKPMYVFVTATWCGACQTMKAQTLSQPGVQKVLADSYIPLLIDADQESNLVEQFQIEAYPTSVVVNSQLKIVTRIVGIQTPPDLEKKLATLPKAKAVAQRSVEANDPA